MKNRLIKQIGFQISITLFFLLLSPKNIKAQFANDPLLIGPEIPNSIAGISVVDAQNFQGVVSIINQLTDSPHNTVPSRTSSAAPIPGSSIPSNIVLRLWVDSNSTADQARTYASQLIQSNQFPNGALVVFGVELNNLDSGFWNNPSTTIEEAAKQYAEIFIAFAEIIGSDPRFPVAPAPPDLYNAVYDPVPWINTFNSTLINHPTGDKCYLIDALAADVFDNVQPRIPTSPTMTWQYLEQNICHGDKQVVHFQGWGDWPGKSVKDQVDFLDSTPLPKAGVTATTLIAPNCGPQRADGTTWWYYIPDVNLGKGRVFKPDGTEVDPETCVLTNTPGDGYSISDIECPLEYFPEFHSLRPYPACPLPPDIMDTSFLLCGNDLITQETLEIRYGEDLPDGISLIDCTEDGQNIICNYEITNRNIPIRVDLSEADLPIMGLTEDPFSTEGDEPWPHQRIPDSVTPAQRMNEYVSWYLNGTIFRAEENVSSVAKKYPEKEDNMTEEGYQKSLEDTRNLIDFSGPLRKLLPWRIQIKERVDEIEKATASPQERHNQVAACYYEATDLLKFLGTFQSVTRFLFNILPGTDIPNFNPFDLFGQIPGPCYPNEEPKTLLGQDLIKITPLRLKDWEAHTPPVDEEYNNFPDYWRAFQEWRGKICSPQILGTRFYICFDEGVLGLPDSWVDPNYWGSLFSYIPFSSTEDRTGYAEGRLDTALTQQPPSDANITDINFTPNPGTILPDDGKMRFLYFPHMQESAELGYLLQQTFLTKGEDGFSNINEQGYYNTERCEYLDARKNPGDDLYGGDFGQEDLPWIQPKNDERTIDGNITYSGTFQCSFYLAEPACDGIGYPGQIHCNLDECRPYLCTESGNWEPVWDPITGGVGQYPCSGSAGSCTSSSTFSPPDPGLCTINISTATSIYIGTPKAEEVWDRLVNGSQSVFRKIYPKVGAEAPIEEIEDIPAEADATYTAETDSGEIQVFAGNPDQGRLGSDAKIFFPHIGSIYDYFLKGIQKALRPFSSQFNEGDITTDPSENESSEELLACYDDNVFNSYVNATNMGILKNTPLENAIQAAANKYNVQSCVLYAILSTEGSRMRATTTRQQQILTSPWTHENPMDEFLAQGLNQEEAELLFQRAYCSTNEAGAAGPYQITAFAWNYHKNASLTYLGNHIPNRCNFADAVFAAAEMLSSKICGIAPWTPGYGYECGTNFSQNPLGNLSNPEPFCYAGEGYYGSCRMDVATCRLGTNYCDYIRKYCGIPGDCSDYRKTDPR